MLNASTTAVYERLLYRGMESTFRNALGDAEPAAMIANDGVDARKVCGRSRIDAGRFQQEMKCKSG